MDVPQFLCPALPRIFFFPFQAEIVILSLEYPEGKFLRKNLLKRDEILLYKLILKGQR